MTPVPATSEPVRPAPLAGRFGGRTWAVPLIPVVAFLACRALAVVAALAVPLGGRHGSIGRLAALRVRALAADGGWYARIAAGGYPAVVPREVHGRVIHSALAFFPLYPALTAGVERVLGVAFLPVAEAITLVAGAAAAAGVAVLTRSWAAPGVAVLAGVLWAVAPASPVTGLPYTESLFTAEVVAVLLLLRHRHYGWLLPVLVAAGLTRGTMPPLILVVAAHLVVRLRERSRGAAPDGVAWPAVALAVAVLSAPLWPIAVAVRTGRLDAYAVVQSGWNGRLELFRPWARALHAIAESSPGRAVVPDVALGSVVLAVVLALAALRLPLPVEERVLAPAVLLYLIAVVPPSSSYPRFLLPVVTLPIAAAGLLAGRRPILGWTLVGACLVGQAAWLACYVLGFRHLTP